MRIGVLFGGRSGEHEVSLASAAAVVHHLDPNRYEPVPILISKDGRWSQPERPPTVVKASELIEHARLRAAGTVPNHQDDIPGRPKINEPSAMVQDLALDVIFPVLHGPYGEDGTVQGLLEMIDMPYVGAGVLASAVGMDKAVMKQLFAANNLPQVDYRIILQSDWTCTPDAICKMIASELGFPVFVKPANLGSSVGISKVTSANKLKSAMAYAAEFDRKVVVEQAVPNAREIECAVLGYNQLEASIPGEVIPSREFYDYEAKYVDEGSALRIPAPLDAELTDKVQHLAVTAFRAIDGSGMARVDFLLNDETKELFVSEVNTIPGFTTVSMYPKLWEASGVAYVELLNRLIQLALEKHAAKKLLRTSFS